MVQEDKKMTMEEIRMRIKGGSKDLRSRMVGFSKWNAEELRSKYAKALRGETVGTRKVGQNKWSDALKSWNSDRPTWAIPKKGTREHGEVVQIMNSRKAKSAKQSKGSRVKPAKVEVVSDVESDIEDSRVKVDTKPKRGRGRPAGRK